MTQQASVSLADHDTLKSELAICCRQLQSKDQALKIMKQELDHTQEQLAHSRQEIAQLRSQLARSSSAPQHDLIDEREQFISLLETTQERVSELERKLQMEEDEKEEVLGERDYFSSQCSALKKCLEEKENEQPPSQNALHTLAEENRQLKLKLVEVQAERDRAQARIDRYKRALDHRKFRDSQDKQLSTAGKHHNMQQTLHRMSELEVLANSMSESVKEKSIALTHQKKANKMLGARIAELEHRLKVLEISGLWSGSSGPVLDLTWNEDSDKERLDSKKGDMELLCPEISSNLPTTPSPSQPLLCSSLPTSVNQSLSKPPSQPHSQLPSVHSSSPPSSHHHISPTTTHHQHSPTTSSHIAGQATGPVSSFTHHVDRDKDNPASIVEDNPVVFA